MKFIHGFGSCLRANCFRLLSQLTMLHPNCDSLHNRSYNIQNFSIFFLSLSLLCVRKTGDLSITFFSSLAQFKNERPQQKLIYGKPGKISCTAEGNLPPQFEWNKNNTLDLKDDRLTQLSGGSLQIDRVRWQDKGVYECFMKQTKGRQGITVSLQRINVFVIGG